MVSKDNQSAAKQKRTNPNLRNRNKDKETRENADVIETVGSEETSCIRQLCGCPENLRVERLEYNYDHDDTNKRKQQPLPRIRQRGEHYIDSFNGETYSCSFGTSEEVSRYLILMLEFI